MKFIVILCCILELLQMLMYYGDRYDHPTRIWVGPDLYLLTANPEEVQVLLNAPECLNRDTTYEFVKPLMGNGLVTLPVAKWKEHRRLINPTFNRHVLKSYIPIFNAETNTLAKLVGQELGKGSFDIYKYIDRCTLDTICRKLSDPWFSNIEFNTVLLFLRNDHGDRNAHTK